MSEVTESVHQYSTLSMKDLADARDAYHVHLIHKANVVATALGRYLIRKTDPQFGAEPGPRGTYPRTLSNSEVRPYSWPCVLVFVKEWWDPEKFSGEQATDMIPDRLYLPDGRIVPVCVVYAPIDEAAHSAPTQFRWPRAVIGGGYPILVDSQGEEHVASIGCLVSDGHTIYALTNRHVAGRPGERISTILGDEKVEIGTTSDLQLSKLPFEALYEGFKGHDQVVNMDIGLVEIDDLSQWTAQVYSLGVLGEMDDFGTDNLSMSLIGQPVRAFGASSREMYGTIHGLFYRYKSIGGVEYVSDFLIGPRGDQPLNTMPGDSGTLWVREASPNDFRPLCVQWGGHVFLTGNQKQEHPYALATSLCNVCEHLDVDVIRDWSIGLPDYWGQVGHFTIANRAIDAIQNAELKAFMAANLANLTYTDDQLQQIAAGRKPDMSFVPLSDVPDLVWKQTAQKPGGRDKPGDKSEHPNHFADMDKKDSDSRTLLDICNGHPENVIPSRWIQYYQDPEIKESLTGAGLLPFRVWQFFDGMAQAAKAGDATKFLCAAGIVSHYIGDACQPLHISYKHDGDPANSITHTVHHRDGTTSDVSQPVAMGVHSDYEDLMVDHHTPEILNQVKPDPSIQGPSMAIRNGHDAAVAIVELMQNTFNTLTPTAIVDAYTDALNQGIKKKSGDMADFLWSHFSQQTVDVMTLGGRYLAAIWDAAWAQGNLTNAGSVDSGDLQNLYQDDTFMPSMTIDKISSVLQGVDSAGGAVLVGVGTGN